MDIKYFQMTNKHKLWESLSSESSEWFALIFRPVYFNISRNLPGAATGVAINSRSRHHYFSAWYYRHGRLYGHLCPLNIEKIPCLSFEGAGAFGKMVKVKFLKHSSILILCLAEVSKKGIPKESAKSLPSWTLTCLSDSISHLFPNLVLTKS